MAEYKLKHTGAVIDQQIDRVLDGSVVVDNTLSALDENSNKPVNSEAVYEITTNISRSLTALSNKQDNTEETIKNIAVTGGASVAAAVICEDGESVETKLRKTPYKIVPPTKGLITFVTDDGNTQDYTLYLPMFNEKRVPFSTAVIVNKVGQDGFATLQQLKEMQRDGHEIISHTMSHPHLSELPEVDAEAELRDSHEWLIDNGFGGEVVAFPYGYWGEREKRLASKYYKAARCSDMGVDGTNYSPIETFELKAIWLDPDYSIKAEENVSGYVSNTWEFYKYYIDDAVANNKWLIIGSHSGTISHRDDLVTLLSQVIDYAKSNSEVVTFKVALERMGNALEVGNLSKTTPSQEHYAIGYDGAEHSNAIRCLYKELNAMDGSTAFAELDNYATSVCFVNTQKAVETTLPESISGLLISRKYNDTGGFKTYWRKVNKQTYITSTGNEYERYPNGDAWSAWVDMSNSIHLNEARDTTTFNSPITAYKKGISYDYISGANAAVTPCGEAGVLITMRISDTSTSAYNMQIYISFSTVRTFIRKANGESWNKWYEKGSNSYITDANAFDCATAISAFDFGITYTPINTATATASNAPESMAGTLITYKVSTTSLIYNFQEYRVILGSKSYRRGFNSDGTPTAWVKFCE